jgi:transcriptional regulator with XRE-family HTH domain
VPKGRQPSSSVLKKNLAKKAAVDDSGIVSNFSETLTTLMKVERRTQLDLESASGVDRATISRFQNEQRLPDRRQLSRLLVAISGDRDRRLQLLLSHLRDEATAGIPAGIDSRHFVLRAVDENVPDGLGADLVLLAEEAEKQADIRRLLSDLAHMVLRHRATLQDEADGLARERAALKRDEPDAPVSGLVV